MVLSRVVRVIEVKERVRGEVKGVREGVKTRGVREEVKAGVREEVKAIVREEVKARGVREEVKARVREEVKARVR